jgi:ABC-2 type transport system ATP-binding protein
MADELAVVATGLVKSYGAVPVLAGIDLRIRRGTVFALLGPNGAGKTTTVRILSTLTSPDAGTARVAGFDVIADRRRVRRSIALTGQYPAVDDLQTGTENLDMMARLVGLSRRDGDRRARGLLDRFDLAAAADRRVATYSGGMRRRLDLAVSLLAPPAVLFLDEPTAGLDPRSRRMVWEVVAEVVAGGATVLLTTQYLEEADRLAHHVAVIDGGRVVADGSAAELKERVAGHRLDLTLADHAGFEVVSQALGSRAVHRDPGQLVLGVATDPGAAAVRALLDEVDPGRDAVVRFAVHAATLDDVFLALTGRRTTGSENTRPEKENAGV